MLNCLVVHSRRHFEQKTKGLSIHSRISGTAVCRHPFRTTTISQQKHDKGGGVSANRIEGDISKQRCQSHESHSRCSKAGGARHAANRRKLARLRLKNCAGQWLLWDSSIASIGAPSTHFRESDQHTAKPCRTV